MRLLISLLASLWLALPVHGQTPKPAKANYSITHKMQNTYDPRLQPYSGLELSGTFNVWYLLGEAAVNCTARWENPGVLQVIMEDGTRVLSEPGEEDMWNLMLMAQFPNPDKKAKRFTNGGGAHLSIFCDAGIVAQSGNNGFNVAGSPNWDKFICATPKKVDPRYTFDVNQEATDNCGAIGGDWLSPAEAKQVAIAGVKVDDISVLSVELSASATLRRAEKIRWRKTSHTFKQSRASSLLSRLRTKNQQQALGFAQRQYDLNTKANNPGPQDLKNYDDFIKQLESALGETDPTREWRERDQDLVSAQLDRIREIDNALREQDSKLTRYQKELSEQMKAHLEQGRFELVQLEPEMDKGTSLWGYKLGAQKAWFIEPRFITAGPFDENGTAEVILVDELVKSEKGQETQQQCGRTEVVHYTKEARRKKIARINYKEHFVKEPEWRAYETSDLQPWFGFCLRVGG